MRGGGGSVVRLVAVELEQSPQVDGLRVDQARVGEQQVAQLVLEGLGLVPDLVEPVERGVALGPVVVDEAELEVGEAAPPRSGSPT